MMFTYLIPCYICGTSFSAKRKHARTCSSRCRHIWHKLNVDIQNFASHLDYTPSEMLKSQIDIKRQFVNNAKMSDEYGNAFEFIYGNLDLQGNVVIAVFRNDALKYLMAWYDYKTSIVTKFYNFHKSYYSQ